MMWHENTMMSSSVKVLVILTECVLFGAVLGAIASLPRFGFCWREATVIGSANGLIWGGLVLVCLREHNSLQKVLLSAFFVAIPFSYVAGHAGVLLPIVTVYSIVLVWPAIYAMFKKPPEKESAVRVRYFLLVTVGYFACLVLFAFCVEMILAPSRLIEAAARGDMTTVRNLIDQGVSVNGRDGFQGSAIMYACVRDHNDVVELLLRAGAPVNDRSRGGRTPLMIAASNGNYDLVCLLMRWRAQKGLVDTNGQTAKDLALAGGHQRITDYLSVPSP